MLNFKEIGYLMTPERIDKVVEKLRQLAATRFSDYAGFHFNGKPGEEYHHCFVVNDQEYHSSNFTLELENFSDAVEIIQKFTGESKEKVLKDLEITGCYIQKTPLYLHYLKLFKKCEK